MCLFDIDALADSRPPRPAVVVEKETQEEPLIEYQDEFAEEELTEEEKEYLKAFCDLDDLCLVCHYE